MPDPRLPGKTSRSTTPTFSFAVCARSNKALKTSQRHAQPPPPSDATSAASAPPTYCAVRRCASRRVFALLRRGRTAIGPPSTISSKWAAATRASLDPELFRRLRIRLAAGHGGYPLVGTPDHIADEMAKISHAGFTGLALSFVDYLNEFPYFRDEVLPRLVRLGVRES